MKAGTDMDPHPESYPNDPMGSVREEAKQESVQEPDDEAKSLSVDEPPSEDLGSDIDGERETDLEAATARLKKKL